ncbi:MAG: hypothetical protein EZS28_009709 [Streblomastix strix]|uniref:Uncharacterized protein n=1 Tax=Streblomastix strix TaxID=222440 RepID=A0A5J4WJQ1_9EUKA|nr:MAG: hypothetical protein EZS28_009709 [Streblomastix strix]
MNHGNTQEIVQGKDTIRDVEMEEENGIEDKIMNREIEKGVLVEVDYKYIKGKISLIITQTKLFQENKTVRDLISIHAQNRSLIELTFLCTETNSIQEEIHVQTFRDQQDSKLVSNPLQVQKAYDLNAEHKHGQGWINISQEQRKN